MTSIALYNKNDCSYRENDEKYERTIKLIETF